MSKKKDEIDYEAENIKADIQIGKLERELLYLTKEGYNIQEMITKAEAQISKQQDTVDIERADRYDIVQDMNRQFKQMQEDLLKEIGEREKNIETAR